MYRAWRRRHLVAASERARTARRSETRRPLFLFQHLRLDDVEYSGQRPAVRSHHYSLRWLAVLSQTRHVDRHDRSGTAHGVRHQRALSVGAGESWRQTARVAFTAIAADHSFDRLNAGA